LLGYNGNAYYGFDNITLGLVGAGLPTLSHQLIAGIATPDFWVGSLGLSPLPVNFTTQNEPIPSLLGTLRDEKQIPSTSWAYTAGAHYQDPPVFGSLTFGGYDSTRFVPNNISIAFGADQSRDLVVGLQTITYDSFGSTPLLASGIYAFIDSMVPHIWLPIEVCHAFEQAFNLTWNDTAELYLVDDAVHDKLVAQNPTITFTVGSAAKGGESVDISIPYGAFDLNVKAPLVTSTSHYFPLKRAQNSSQYTLGRVFLQQAYVIADYDRSNFSVSQALFPSTSVAQHLVPILPSGVASTPGAASTPVSHRGLSSGAIAGIAIAAAVAILLLAFVTVIYVRRQRRRRITPGRLPQLPGQTGDSSAAQILKPELDAYESAALEHNAPNSEKAELPAYNRMDARQELEDRMASQKNDTSQNGVYELAGSHAPAIEIGERG
jgi:Eukaryotic aspartyl protease